MYCSTSFLFLIACIIFKYCFLFKKYFVQAMWVTVWRETLEEEKFVESSKISLLAK